MAYAIFKTGGKQYKVQKGDKIDVERLALEVGSDASFGEVLFVSDNGSIKIGDPVLQGASVSARVLDQHRGKKTISFKYKRRKGFHKTKGHRRELTRLEITGISA
jgi:large subunit ribosomal protein L21